MTRRKILIAISQMAAAATLAACSRSAGSAEAVAANPDLELLSSIAYDILPFAELPPALYVKAGQQILDLRNESVAAGLDTLRAACDGTTWKDVPEARRVEILRSVQSSPFFAAIRSRTLQVLLRDKATFAVVGYGGSSMEYGGYIGRGFNDINWLPAPASK